MRRRIENPRIVLLDCNLEYKKGESQTSLEILKEEDITKILQQVIFYFRKLKKKTKFSALWKNREVWFLKKIVFALKIIPIF